jgi:hypothetical protein
VSFEFADYDAEKGGVGALCLFSISLGLGIADKGARVKGQYHET